MNYAELLILVRGPLFDIALTIFIFGIILRIVEIFMLGKKVDLSEARNSHVMGGLQAIGSRFVPRPEIFKRTRFIVLMGYVFHIGLFIVLFAFIPHILIFEAWLGFGWPGLPTPIVDFITVITMLAMIALLVNRLRHPVLRMLSTYQDYLVWTVTFLPLLTGYLAFHHLLLPYPLMLALHILTVELLMVVFPFTKLMHTFTTFIARYYNGAYAAHRGVKA